VVNGTLFFGSGNGTVYSLDQTPAVSIGRSSREPGSLARYNRGDRQGPICSFLWRWQATIYALNAQSGELLEDQN